MNSFTRIFLAILSAMTIFGLADLFTTKQFTKHLKAFSFFKRLCVFFVLGTMTNNVLFPLLESESPYKLGYALFYVALTVTMFTDALTFLISRFVTIYLVPIGWALSYCGYLPISPLESITGSIIGLMLLAGINKISRRFLGRDGLGQGDVDLMAFIGAFTGPIGCWFSLMIGSIIGSVCGTAYMLIFKKSRNDFLLPFGCFLAGSAIMYVLFQEPLIKYFFPTF